MATENWYPTSTATHDLPAGMDDWSVTGANKNVATTVGGGRAGPATDDDATFISEITNGEDQALNIDWPGPMSSWDGVLTANWRISVTLASGTVSFELRKVNAAGTSGGAIFSETLANTGFAYSGSGSIDISNGAVYRPGGGSWVAADFTETATFSRAVRTAGADGACHVSSIWGTISYTPGSGGFAFLLQLAGLSALPFVGAMDFGQFMRYLSWRRAHHPRHTILTGAEVRRAWRELREYKHPTFFLPGVA